MTPEPFMVQIPDAAVQDLHARLQHIRWPADFNNNDWRYGVPRAYLESFVESWRNYDWRETEAEINGFDNYKVTMDGMPLTKGLNVGDGVVSYRVMKIPVLTPWLIGCSETIAIFVGSQLGHGLIVIRVPLCVNFKLV